MAKNDENKKTQTLEDYYNERVKIVIPRPEGNNADSETVTLNGRLWQIQYDEEVEVPRSVALIIQESERNRKAAAKRAFAMRDTSNLGEF